jgi:hypothetical protein
MKQVLVGFIIGMALGTAVTSYAAKLVGENGYLRGWTVTVDREEVCSDPYVHVYSKEIECE